MKRINEQRLVTALDEVKYLRGASEISIDYRNSNRYRLVVSQAELFHEAREIMKDVEGMKVVVFQCGDARLEIEC